jgi:hypothetical protein
MSGQFNPSAILTLRQRNSCTQRTGGRLGSKGALNMMKRKISVCNWICTFQSASLLFTDWVIAVQTELWVKLLTFYESCSWKADTVRFKQEGDWVMVCCYERERKRELHNDVASLLLEHEFPNTGTTCISSAFMRFGNTAHRLANLRILK